MARVTIQKIAEYVGVSRGTVDRVLHNRPNVKPEVREAVLKAARLMGYIDGQEEAKSTKKKIALLLPGNHWFDNNLRDQWLRGVSDAKEIVSPLGVQVEVIACETDLPNEFAGQIQRLQQEGLDGIALTAKDSPVMEHMIQNLHEAGVRVVLYNSDIPNSGRDCFIGQDVYRSGRVAANLMVKALQEEDEILVVAGNLEIFGHKQRVQGFSDKCRECGIASYRISIVESYNEYLLTYEKVTEILLHKPQVKAIYMANESVPACAEAIRRSGRQDIKMVIGNDLTDETKQLLKDGVVDFIIEQDVYAQGFQSVVRLKNMLLTPDASITSHIFTRIGVINAENM